MPLPCSPVSNSTASESYSVPNTSEEESDASLTTPRAGPSDPTLRTSESLSRPSVPTFQASPESEAKVRDSFKDKTDAVRAGAKDELNPSRPDSGKAASLNIESTGRKSSVRFLRRDSSSRQRALHSPLQTAGNMARVSPPTSPFSGAKPRDDGHEAAESSADENTAIFRRENTASRVYGAAGASDGLANDDGASSRRRTNTGKGKDGQGDSNGTNESRNGREDDDDKHADGSSWWKRTAEKYGSIELENKGSVARDHLALERTFLAWLRTSLSFASIGIAITQLFRLNTSLRPGGDDDSSASSKANDPAAHLKQVGKPLGATFLGISILILLLGFNRYFEGQHYVIRGKFPASRASIVLVSLVAGALIIASLAVVLVVAPSAFET